METASQTSGYHKTTDWQGAGQKTRDGLSSREFPHWIEGATLLVSRDRICRTNLVPRLRLGAEPNGHFSTVRAQVSQAGALSSMSDFWPAGPPRRIDPANPFTGRASQRGPADLSPFFDRGAHIM